MLTKEANQRVTQVGPGTPMGKVFRQYWIPFAIHEELPEPDCPPLRVRLLGEDLIAFRSSDGTVGLLDAYCPHRMAPLFFGRNEECGLRCVYHGWKFDVDGQCVDMPNEPPESNFKHKVKITSYPTFEAGGALWTYMGPSEEMPPKPDYEWLRAPHTHVSISKTYENCNYLQAIEGGIDTSHSSFLHNNELDNKKNLRSIMPSPKLEVEKTPYGFRYVGIRDLGERGNYIRAYQFIMPFQQMRGGVTKPAGGDQELPTIHGHMWVPIDDESVYVYNFMYAFDKSIPLTKEYVDRTEARLGRAPSDYLPGQPAYRLKANEGNDYLIDREEQRTKTYSGIKGVNTQDYALQENMSGGNIVDRTKEHLGTTDVAIITARQLLLEAADELEKGNTIRGVDPSTYRDVRAVDRILAHGVKWREALAEELKAIY